MHAIAAFLPSIPILVLRVCFGYTKYWQFFAVYTREIVKKALSVGAFGVLISHNHPSQECKPSHADIRLTERLQCAFSAVGIDLIDHVIVTSDDHLQYKRYHCNRRHKSFSHVKTSIRSSFL